MKKSRSTHVLRLYCRCAELDELVDDMEPHRRTQFVRCIDVVKENDMRSDRVEMWCGIRRHGTNICTCNTRHITPEREHTYRTQFL